MDTTQSKFYLKVLFIVAILSFMVYDIGIVSNNSALITLDQKSQDFVSSYANYYVTTGFDDIKDEQIGDYATIEILTGNNETGEIISTDFFSIPKATQGAMATLPNAFKLIFNVPNLVLMGMGVPSKDFANYVNIFGWLMSISMLIVFVKMIFNGGNS